MHLCAVFKLLKVLSLIDGIGLLSPNTKMFKDFNPLFSESKVKYHQIYWLIFGSIAQNQKFLSVKFGPRIQRSCLTNCYFQKYRPFCGIFYSSWKLLDCTANHQSRVRLEQYLWGVHRADDMFTWYGQFWKIKLIWYEKKPYFNNLQISQSFIYYGQTTIWLSHCLMV